MSITNIQDAQEVERSLQSILAAPDINARIQTVRTLFVEILDYYPADQRVSLRAASNGQLPDDAYIVARRDGVSAVYVPLDDTTTNRITGTAASAAAKVIGNALADEPLLLFTNRDGDQLHIIRPDLLGSRPQLQRIVAHRGQHQRTVVQQIANMWDDYGNRGKTISDAIANAFSVEPVTKEFFETYRKIFEDAKASISGFSSTKADQEDKHLFTQTLFNRLMFVYFLSRKAWLKFNDDTDYLNALWHDHQLLPSHGNFYTTRLRTLFFAGLNDPRPMDLTQGSPTLIGEVPFLNGGLFEETDLDRREGITVPDETIQQVLIGLFDKFNFTVTESTPFDVEVAVDPEMLGKIFEELVTGRHDSGAYYTPRPVVSFMCREALKGYLEGQETGVDADAITQFVDRQDTSSLNLAAARRISEALSEVTAVDPACGSGAYLLGMMQELIELQTTLYNVGVDSKALYDLKLEIIQHNLYGVDIDEFAVNIAMLRMWLSLAIDYEGESPPPLPNLDFKVLRGDSLLGLDPISGAEVQGSLGYSQDKVQLLGRLKGEFLRESKGVEKDRLRTEIASVNAEILDSLGVVANEGVLNWRVEFAEVFGGGRGFDIAIANPPYVQLQKDAGRLGELYQGCGYTTFTKTGDIYQLFYERGCQVLRPGQGTLAYITSNSWLRAEYGKPLRRYFAEKHTPLLLLELGKDVFESAIVDSGVLMLRTGGPAQPFPAVDMDRVKSAEVPPSAELWGQAKPDGDAPWSVMSLTERRILDKMRAKGTLLKEWDVSIYRGVTTGYNSAFIIDSKTRESLVSADPKSADIIKEVLRGKDIQRFRSEWTGRWLITTFPARQLDIEDYPAIRQYLLTYGKERLEQSGKALPDGSKARKKTQHSWFELQDSTAYYEEFSKEKLVWIELVDNGRFAYDNSGVYGEATTFMMTGRSLKYLCAVLNSTLIRWFLQQTAPTSGMGTSRWKKVYVENIPIPQIAEEQQRSFVQLVDEILEAKAADLNADASELERNIDRLVYDLYGLTEEEDTGVERSLGLIHVSDEEEDQAILRAVLEGEADPENVAGEISRAEFEEIMMTWREEELAG